MIERIRQAINEELEKRGTIAKVPEPYETYPYDQSLFLPLAKTSGKVTFIDGGNQSLYSSNSFTLQFIRIVGVTYDGTSRAGVKKKEFYALIKKEDQFVVELFGEINYPVKIEAESLENAVDVIRRYKELQMANEFEHPVVDGNLIIDNPIFDALITKKLSALSKTNHLLSDKHTSVAVDLIKLSPYDCWYYPLAKAEHTMYVAKLHEKSKYVFKIETTNSLLINILANVSKDPTFLGYPYGLLQADKLARVTNEESRFLRLKLLSRLDEVSITQHLNTQNAHEILDNL